MRCGLRRASLVGLAGLGMFVGAPSAAARQAPAPPAPAATAPPAPRSFRDEPALPETLAFRLAAEVLELLNARDEARWEAFVRERFEPGFRDSHPMEDHLQVFREMADSAPLKAAGARRYTPPDPESRAVLVVRNETMETWQAVVVEVEAAAPHRVVGVSLSPARAPADTTPASPLPPEQVAEQFGAYIDRLAAKDRFSGTALLAKDGTVLTTRAVGVANRDFNAPVRLDTRFNLGSMNKMFTAVAMMRLVEAGKVSLDDPISKYLSEDWLPKVDKTRVTVRHLLTHSSGLGSYFNKRYDESSRLLFRKVDDYKALVADETLQFEPGTRSRYSNTGMLIAGAVIESASGTDYFEFVRREVTGPAGMTSTDCYELDKVNPNLAVGYEARRTPTGVTYRNNIFDHVLRGGPAGGGYSTAEDLLRFDLALRSKKLLRQESLDQLWKAYPELDSPRYGLGFGVEETPAGKVVGHGGGFTGINSNLDMFLDAGYTVVVMSNFSGGANPVAARAMELITRGR